MNAANDNVSSDAMLDRFNDNERTYNTKHSHQLVEVKTIEARNWYLFYLYYLIALLLIYFIVRETAYNRYIKYGIIAVILGYPYLISPISNWLALKYQLIILLIRGEVVSEQVNI